MILFKKLSSKNQITIYLISIIIILLLFISTILLQKIYKIPSKITRKIIHIFTGPIFILTWKLYPKGNYGKIASTIPFLASGIFFLLHILKKYKISKLLKNIVSRSGESIELIEGPFFYGIIIGTIPFVLFFFFHIHNSIYILYLLVFYFLSPFLLMNNKNYNLISLPNILNNFDYLIE